MQRLILLFGIFLGSHAPAAAQTPAVQIVLAHAYVAPAITILRPVSAPLPAASFQVYQYPQKPPAYFDHVFAGAYERDDSMERLPPTEEVKTSRGTTEICTVVNNYILISRSSSTRTTERMRVMTNKLASVSRPLSYL